MKDVNCGQRIHCPGRHEHMQTGFTPALVSKKTTKAWTLGYLLDVNIYIKRITIRKKKS